jgi:zinc/manganese transport system substrate-binding protein
MAEACGLKNLTPQGYQSAAANESEPAPGDLAAFNKELANQVINVLINNTQTDGSVPQQLVKTAQGAQVPVVNVTETMPADATTFQQWQIAQLQVLAAALGVSTG